MGFGLDAHALLGLKLDGGGGTDGSSLLPVSDGSGKAPGSFSTAGGTLKLRALDSELKAGDLFLGNPVIAGGRTRMLPQTFRGFSLANHSVDGLLLEGGRASFTKLYNQSGHRRIGTAYGSLPDARESRHLDWLGAYGRYSRPDQQSVRGHAQGHLEPVLLYYGLPYGHSLTE